MNLPNKLTMLRLCLVPVNMALLLLPESVLPWYVVYPVAAVLFILTSLTDMLDGKIARARNLITDFGKFMDPVADKFMVIGTLMTLGFRMANPAAYGVTYQKYFVWVYFATVVAIVFRELAITSLRLVLVNSAGKVVAANMLGKIKTVSQIVFICAMLIEPSVNKLIHTFHEGWYFSYRLPLCWIFLAVTCVFTILSGVNYIAANWKSFTKDW